jgi:hypothetical protein
MAKLCSNKAASCSENVHLPSCDTNFIPTTYPQILKQVNNKLIVFFSVSFSMLLEKCHAEHVWLQLGFLSHFW